MPGRWDETIHVSWDTRYQERSVFSEPVPGRFTASTTVIRVSCAQAGMPQAGMPQVVQALFTAISLAGGVNQGQVTGAIGFQKIGFQSNGQLFREADPDELRDRLHERLRDADARAG